MRNYLIARQDATGYWFVVEHRDSNRPNIISGRIGRDDAELLVKRGNQFFSLLEATQRDYCGEPIKSEFTWSDIPF